MVYQVKDLERGKAVQLSDVVVESDICFEAQVHGSHIHLLAEILKKRTFRNTWDLKKSAVFI